MSKRLDGWVGSRVGKAGCQTAAVCPSLSAPWRADGDKVSRCQALHPRQILRETQGYRSREQTSFILGWAEEKNSGAVGRKAVCDWGEIKKPCEIQE